jgi:UDP-N-acetylmuramoylalanine--D-glutamate ligase
MMIQQWHGKRVTVMGLGRFGGGVGVTRWLARAGARVLVTDRVPAERLAGSLAQLADLPIELRLGRHDEHDFREADVVVVNPAVPDHSPFLQAARAAGVPVTTEMNLFVQRCPASCVGVTGSVGKSTITAMIGHVLRAASAGRRVWVGGNIGRSLLDDLAEIRPDDIVVLELSSFQLERTPTVHWSPHIAVISNVSENHLDWHGSFAAYLKAKLNILRFQDRRRDALVLGDTPALRSAVREAVRDHARAWYYGLDDDNPRARGPAFGLAGSPPPELRWPDVRLNVPGQHNRLNAAAALTVAHLYDIPPDRAVAALESFAALPDRLQRVADRDGVTYYNDSKSTTPEAALTGMAALKTPVLIIVGGYDKGSDLRQFADIAARRAKFAACIGQTGATLAELIRAAGGNAELCGDLPTAVDACSRRAEPGDTVLLSPACASWDQFDDYRARGEAFTQLVQRDGGPA